MNHINQKQQYATETLRLHISARKRSGAWNSWSPLGLLVGSSFALLLNQYSAHDFPIISFKNTIIIIACYLIATREKNGYAIEEELKNPSNNKPYPKKLIDETYKHQNIITL